ncbi:Hypothetical protein, putative [Bodo saltans]|uniref:Uncharacterized protein n=1 Tax=Bodo saltans TaxID=75058 RepID=A0A0S4JIK5_BODSA|nr:Hypothetical protein, putative [Bodo saltans]|eukprot:CUG91363.1 Hypothetical protein, putative [Bodo saltans]
MSGGGDHVHAVPSSRPVLTAKVVRPPAEGDALQSSRRPCTATHRRAGIALVPVKFSGDRKEPRVAVTHRPIPFCPFTEKKN